MKIYTKTGDRGTTGLIGGERRPKSDIQIEAYGTVDELNSHLGLVADRSVNNGRRELHTRLQSVLFDVGAHLAIGEEYDRDKLPKLHEQVITQLESEIDQMNTELEELKSFILPGGNEQISQTHIARSVCRRAERRVVALSEEIEVDDFIIVLLNRLSDYLFVLARWMAKELKVKEIPWTPSR